tara:strand:- start:24 stop:188 length:165 start_codon:yes stop_codon:yes gene_type:complete
MDSKFDKKKILNFEKIKNSSLLTPVGKEEKKVTIKKIQDINGMEIIFNVIKKKN